MLRGKALDRSQYMLTNRYRLQTLATMKLKLKLNWVQVVA